MINRILEWFKAPDGDTTPLDINLACGVLMVEIMMADDHKSKDEVTQIRQLLQASFHLSTAEQDEVIEAARELVKEANDLYRFTARINEVFDTQAKCALLVDLWKVAYADGQLDRYEEHLIRRISELLHLHHSHFMQAKHAAQQTMGQG